MEQGVCYRYTCCFCIYNNLRIINDDVSLSGVKSKVHTILTVPAKKLMIVGMSHAPRSMFLLLHGTLWVELNLANHIGENRSCAWSKLGYTMPNSMRLIDRKHTLNKLTDAS